MPLAIETVLLHRVTALNASASRRVSELLSNDPLVALAQTYEENLKKRHVDLGFNVFALVSDLYYRENFHSDVLRAVLDPAGKHQAKEKYLHLFLNFIKAYGAAVVPGDYRNS